MSKLTMTYGEAEEVLKAYGELHEAAQRVVAMAYHGGTSGRSLPEGVQLEVDAPVRSSLLVLPLTHLEVAGGRITLSGRGFMAATGDVEEYEVSLSWEDFLTLANLPY